jgi:hypothetical protein
MNRIRQILTVLLILSAVSGAQLLQASPLHNHDSEITSCALCHFDNNDQYLPETHSDFTIQVTANGKSFYTSFRYHYNTFSLFQGRAPPLFSL